MDKPKNIVESFLEAIKGNRITAFFIICGIVIIGLASFTDALKKLWNVFPDQKEKKPIENFYLAGRDSFLSPTTLQANFFDQFENYDKRKQIAKLWYHNAYKEHFSEVKSRDILIEWADNILRSIPDNAILFVFGDDDFYAINYAQEMLGSNSSALITHTSLINLPGYKKYISDYAGFESEELKTEFNKILNPEKVIMYLLEYSGRPKYFSVTCGLNFCGADTTHISNEGLVYLYSSNVTQQQDDYPKMEYNLRNYSYNQITVNGEINRNCEIPVLNSVHYSYALMAAKLSRHYALLNNFQLKEWYFNMSVDFDPSFIKYKI